MLPLSEAWFIGRAGMFWSIVREWGNFSPRLFLLPPTQRTGPDPLGDFSMDVKERWYMFLAQHLLASQARTDGPLGAMHRRVQQV